MKSRGRPGGFLPRVSDRRDLAQTVVFGASSVRDRPRASGLYYPRPDPSDDGSLPRPSREAFTRGAGRAMELGGFQDEEIDRYAHQRTGGDSSLPDPASLRDLTGFRTETGRILLLVNGFHYSLAA